MSMTIRRNRTTLSKGKNMGRCHWKGKRGAAGCLVALRTVHVRIERESGGN